MTLFLAVLLIPSYALAKDITTDSPIYRYTDGDGIEVFTDDPKQIPVEYRSSSKKVTLPPEMLMPSPPSPGKVSSRYQRVKNWFTKMSPTSRLMIVGVLPLVVLSLWALAFFRKRTESPSLKLFFKLGMIALVIFSLYFFYFLYLRSQVEKLMGPIPAGTDIRSFPQKMLEPMQRQEENRLKRIEDIANEK